MVFSHYPLKRCPEFRQRQRVKHRRVVLRHRVTDIFSTRQASDSTDSRNRVLHGLAPHPRPFFPFHAQFEKANLIALWDCETACLKRYIFTHIGCRVFYHPEQNNMRHVRSSYRSYLKIYPSSFLDLDRTFVQSQVNLTGVIEAVQPNSQDDHDCQTTVKTVQDGTTVHIDNLVFPQDHF